MLNSSLFFCEVKVDVVPDEVLHLVVISGESQIEFYLTFIWHTDYCPCPVDCYFASKVDDFFVHKLDVDTTQYVAQADFL